MKKKPKLLLLITEDWYFWSHRLPLARAALAAGYEVVLATHVDRHGDLIRAEGIKLVALGLRRGGRSPWGEALSILELIRLYRKERPDIAHHVAFKPIFYGSLAASAARTPAIVNAFAGLGFSFLARGFSGAALRRVLALAASLCLRRRSMKAIFQNADDAQAAVSAGLVRVEDFTIIRGSGVDLDLFSPKPEPKGEPVVILASRLLWDKGVGEFVAAARRLRRENTPARFALVGDADFDNPAAVPKEKLERWELEGDVELWGRREDMPETMSGAHVVCLPSYREGMPKVLLEAAASARAVVAADVPGCRDAVKDGETGVLVPARDDAALAKALARLISDADLRARMGRAGRKLAEAEFGQDKIVEQTLALYAELLK